MQTTRGLALIRIRADTIGPLSGVVLALFLLACSTGGDERSENDRSETPPPAVATAADSSDTLRGEQPAAQPPAGATAQVDRVTPAQPETAAAQPPAEAAAQVDTGARAQPDTVAALPPADTAAPTPPTLAEVLAQHVDSLTAIRGVVGVDSVACDGGTCIRITVNRRTQSVLSSLPASIEGYQVVVAERRRGH